MWDLTGDKTLREEAAAKFPDDLLSYGVPKSGSSVAITNGFVRNNALKFLIPAAGSVTNPLLAHRGYGTNPLVLQTMLKGVE